MMTKASLGPLLVVAAIAGACSDSDLTNLSEANKDNIRLVVVSGQNQQGMAGSELPAPLVVRVFNSFGAPLQGQAVNFVVTSGGGVTYAGFALTDGTGTAQEWWTLGSQVGEQTLEARAVNVATGERMVFGQFTAEATALEPVASVTVEPSIATIEVGQTVTLTATARNAAGSVLTGRSLTWSSSNTTVARVSATGVVSALNVGNATITATVEGSSGTATVYVSPSVIGLKQSR
jgi:uncharacterized protein YjdB